MEIQINTDKQINSDKQADTNLDKDCADPKGEESEDSGPPDALVAKVISA